MTKKSIYRGILLGLALTGMAVCGYCDFGETGWIIFRKIQSSRFYTNSAASPLNKGGIGFLYNPSVLRGFESSELFLLSEMGPVGDKFGGAFVGLPFGKMAVAGGFAYYDAGKAELSWLDNGELKTRIVNTQREVFGSLSVEAEPFSRVSAGVAVKIARSSLAEQEAEYVLAGDAGIFISPCERMAVTAVYKNFELPSKFNGDRSLLPSSVYMGGGYVLSKDKNYNFLFSGGADYYINEKEIVPAAGIELLYGNLSVDAGYRFFVEEFKIHAGARLRMGNATFGYAYIPGTYFDSAHRFAISYRFGT